MGTRVRVRVGVRVRIRVRVTWCASGATVRAELEPPL